MNEIDLKDTNIQQHILDDIISDWRFGIRPCGELAKSPYVSKHFRPDFSVARPFKKEDTNVASDTDWTNNLIKSGVYEKWDGITMNSLSVTRSLVEPTEQKTYYQIECTPFMVINLSNSSGVTDELNRKLMSIESQHDAVKNSSDTWKKLRLFFEEYGFLWPEIIVIGYKQLTLLEKPAACETNDKFNSLDSFDGSLTYDSIKKWTIIKRKNLRPIFEFLPQFKIFILKVFKSQYRNLKLNTPICWDQKFKLKNMHSSHYLTRQEHTKEEFEPSLCKDRSDDRCIWSFQKPTLYHRRLSEVLQGSEDVFLCTPKYQVPEIEHLVLTSEGPETDLHEVHHVHFSMDFHEKTNEWMLETKKTKSRNQKHPDKTLDDAINSFECLLDGDKIMLRQSQVYLSTNESMFDNIRAFRHELAPRMREHITHLTSSKQGKRKPLQTSKSCILPGKTYERFCTHSARRCGSHLLVKKPIIHPRSENIWKIEVEKYQQSEPLEPSDQSSINTSRNLKIHDGPNQLVESSFQTNIIQSNVKLSSLPGSMTAIRSGFDLTSPRLRASQMNYDQESVSSSDSEMWSEAQSIASGPDTSHEGTTSLNKQNDNADRQSDLTDAQVYQKRMEKYLRKYSDSILYTQSSSMGTYFNEEDGGIYTQGPYDNERTSIKTQKKRMKLLLGLGTTDLTTEDLNDTWIVLPRVDGLDLNKYETSSRGLLKMGNRWLADTMNSDGYVYNRLKCRQTGDVSSFLRHRLVLAAFRLNDFNDPGRSVIGHIDDVRHNNSIDNLETITQKEKSRRGSGVFLSKRTLQGNLIKRYSDITACIEDNPTFPTLLSDFRRATTFIARCSANNISYRFEREGPKRRKKWRRYYE